MDTIPNYAASRLPWQVAEPKAYTTEFYTLPLARRGDTEPLAIMCLFQTRDTLRWHWTILPIRLHGESRSSVRSGYLSKDNCESDLCSAVTYWLGAPPSAYLPTQEGVITPSKEVHCAE
jgi:hypothetical protein